MPAAGGASRFLDSAGAGKERRNGPGPKRRAVLLGVLLVAGLSGGLGLGFHSQLATRDLRVPKPGPRRYPPASRHVAATSH